VCIVAFYFFLIVRISRFVRLLSSREHYTDPDVLSGREVASAYVDGHAPGYGWGWDAYDLGTGSAPAIVGRRGWEWSLVPGDRDCQYRDPATGGGGHRHV